MTDSPRAAALSGSPSPAGDAATSRMDAALAIAEVATRLSAAMAAHNPKEVARWLSHPMARLAVPQLSERQSHRHLSDAARVGDIEQTLSLLAAGFPAREAFLAVASEIESSRRSGRDERVARAQALLDALLTPACEAPAPDSANARCLSPLAALVHSLPDHGLAIRAAKTGGLFAGSASFCALDLLMRGLDGARFFSVRNLAPHAELFDWVAERMREEDSARFAEQHEAIAQRDLREESGALRERLFAQTISSSVCWLAHERLILLGAARRETALALAEAAARQGVDMPSARAWIERQELAEAAGASPAGCAGGAAASAADGSRPDRPPASASSRL
jgi:hypothetical protein